MEKFYIVRNQKALQDIKEEDEALEQQKQFIREFFAENGINGGEYLMGGLGGYNKPIPEMFESNIWLCVKDTQENREKHEKEFKKNPVRGYMREFKKSSKTLKKFQHECAVKKIPVNIYPIHFGDYFGQLRYSGYSQQYFKSSDDMLFLRIISKNDCEIIPETDGFEEIKGSEFFIALESRK